MPSAALRKTIVEPSYEYEKLRRRVYSNTQEMWNYVHSEMIKLKKSLSPGDLKVTKQIDNMLDVTAEHKQSLLNDLDQLTEVDGYEAWRYKEASDLSDLVQRRLHYLQNPENCGKAQKLICRLNKVSSGLNDDNALCYLSKIIVYIRAAVMVVSFIMWSTVS